MPREIEENGKRVVLFTQEEVDAAVTAAKAGLLSEEDAKRLADSAAAKARREAEARLGELQRELEKAGKSAEQVAELQRQIAEQAGKLTGADRTLAGIKALVRAGLSPDAAENLLALPALAGVDFASEEGQKRAVEGVKAVFPQLFPAAPADAPPAPTFTPLGGVGGSPAPAAPAGDLLAQIGAAEAKGEWRQAMTLKNQYVAQQRQQAPTQVVAPEKGT